MEQVIVMLCHYELLPRGLSQRSAFTLGYGKENILITNPIVKPPFFKRIVSFPLETAVLRKLHLHHLFAKLCW